MACPCPFPFPTALTMALAILGAASLNPALATATAEDLPPDPADWVCDLPTPDPEPAIEELCATGEFGTPLPEWLRRPPPLHDLKAKNAYDLELQSFLRKRGYESELGWIHDQGWRLTGPYTGPIGSGKSFGTHPAVRIYYSPEVVEWLCNDRYGDVPDGAMIVKEMFPINEDLGVEIDDDQCMFIENDPLPTDWTIIAKSNESSKDGWYWGYYDSAQSDPPPNVLGNPPIFDRSGITSESFFDRSGHKIRRNPNWYPTGGDPADEAVLPDVVYPNAQYGGYCMNCHSSAVSENTFASLENVVTQGIIYKHFTDDTGSGQGGPPTARHLPAWIGLETAMPSPRSYSQPLRRPQRGFHRLYSQIPPVDFSEAWAHRLPAQTYDHVVSGQKGPQQFLTSDQCISCHNASGLNASQPNMILKDGDELVNLSMAAEWGASPMGLAGRDPIFFAQLQSETNNLPLETECIENLCLQCHGVMGKRQLAIDTPSTGKCENLFEIPPPPGVPSGTPFRLAMVKEWPGDAPDYKSHYGALARDGISCTTCHHVSERALGTEASYTGNFVTGRPDKIFGPFENDSVVPKPMQNTLGITPVKGSQLTDATQGVCQTCHNILLPVFANDGTRQPIGSYEQSTGLEWQNSVYGPTGSDRTLCIDCHMSKTFNDKPLSFKIANIESNEFAPTTFRLPDDEITLTEHDNYARHTLHGLNLFLNQMFQQFPLLLGERQVDPMAGVTPTPALIHGADSMIEFAQQETARIDMSDPAIIEGALQVTATVTNKTGHYLPSGVGFRRLFLEFVVLNAKGKILWASGRTNKLGAIVKGTSKKNLEKRAADQISEGAFSAPLPGDRPRGPGPDLPRVSQRF